MKRFAAVLGLSLALFAARPAHAQTGTLLLATSGVGNKVSELFNSSTGHINVCYSTADSSGSGPLVFFNIEPSGPLITSDVTEQRCVDKFVKPAAYFIDVIAADSSAWDLKIYDVPLQLAPAPGPQTPALAPVSLPAQFTTPQALAIASPAASGTVLSQFSGSGDGKSPTFAISSAQVQICWNVSGRSPVIGSPPFLGFFVQSDTTFDSANVHVSAEEQNCSTANLKSGNYYIKVIATPWSYYSITITAA